MPDLHALPAAQTVVLTVNNRLARRLNTAFVQQLVHNGQAAAELPAILPLAAWHAQQADAALFVPDEAVPVQVLDGFAAQLLWAQAIKQEEKDRPLFDERQLAALAAEADSLIREWALRLHAVDETDESRQLVRWQQRYRKLLARLDAEDGEQAIERTVRLLEQGKLRAPLHLVLAGFRDLSPRMQRLLAAMGAQGTQCHQLEEAPPQVSTAPARFMAADRTAEWRAAAQWAARKLQADPDGRYAILAPRLENDAPFARRVLVQTLGNPDLFNIAIGRPLADWPLVQAALAWLTVLAGFGSWSPAELGAALLAGHCVGDLSEAGERARLDAQWRWRGSMQVGPHEWLRQLFTCPQLSAAWPQARAAFDDGRRNARSDIWARRFVASLTALGFPGERGLDSAAFQVQDEFKALLTRFAGLAGVAGELNARGAVQLLQRLARETPFQPQRSALARLDVLGLLEAEGERWDGVWMLGMTDDVLPSIPKPNPLLPLTALRAAGAPRATPERELAYAQALFAALRDAAPEVIVSHAELDGERELRPSPLIADLLPTAWRPLPEVAVEPIALDTAVDEQGPALNEKDVVNGGVAVLEAQARNPLWAYVRYRLGARELPAYAEQVPLSLRGVFMHKAMETLWRQLADSATLQAAHAEGRLPALIAQAVEEAAPRCLEDLPPVIRNLECARASSVIAAWLELELGRLPFAVAATEAPHTWRHGPLNLNLRLDRLDRLADGSAVVVDYKTGKRLDISGWAKDRPTELQLPLYASAMADDVRGVLLAGLHAREVGARGVADVALGLPGVPTLAELDPDKDALGGLDWDGLRARWQQAIHMLADEFVAGHAANSTEQPGALDYCDALPFLRVTLEQDEEEGA
ncbi:probable DNA repair protein [Andreprevotia lacus DSM 23236]|uniref:Probable DNA repair protein n=2 Tax=Andreprevotia TaxID=397275 RepID=A0A1W1XN14_9NEIS|nr:probable DNA repair protein [Andreprevotia lacus DSM 23236]